MPRFQIKVYLEKSWEMGSAAKTRKKIVVKAPKLHVDPIMAVLSLASERKVMSEREFAKP